MNAPSYFIGLISGTSVDGIDCALVDFSSGQAVLIASHSHEIPTDIKRSILQLCDGKNIDLETLGNTHIALGRLFAQAVSQILADNSISANDVQAIGSHGQTVFHQPNGQSPFTMQIGDPNTIAQLTGITTVADLRGRDMTVGGQGAPLAPLLHQACFHKMGCNRAIVNIGGMSNITVLSDNTVCAYDTGPGNVLMDYWIGKCHGQDYDPGGEWAASGNVDLTLLATLTKDDYFSLPAPKSTGRELFNKRWLDEALASLAIKPSDEAIMATLLELTASTISSEIANCIIADEIYICGGGAHNKTLMGRLAELNPQAKVDSTETLGIHPDWVEAMAFAWLAKQNNDNRKIDTSPFTGATEAVILGGVFKA